MFSAQFAFAAHNLVSCEGESCAQPVVCKQVFIFQLRFFDKNNYADDLLFLLPFWEKSVPENNETKI